MKNRKIERREPKTMFYLGNSTVDPGEDSMGSYGTLISYPKAS